MKLIKLAMALFSFIIPSIIYSQTIVVNNDSSSYKIIKNIQFFNDTNNVYDPQTILQSKKFVQIPKVLYSFWLETDINLWVRFTVLNNSSDTNLLLSLRYGNVSFIDFYKEKNDTLALLSSTGNGNPFSQRQDKDLSLNMKLSLQRNEQATYYLKIKSFHPVLLPLVITTVQDQNTYAATETVIICLYAGILLSILLYNLFLYFSIRDNSYLIYVVYTLLLLIAQLTYAGIAFKLIWPNSPGYNKYAIIITSTLPTIAALIFANVFLHIRKYSRFFYILSTVLIALYCTIPFISFLIGNYYAYNFLTVGGVLAGILVLIASAYIARKGYRPAYYYFISWFVLAVGRMILSLRNANILPENIFTNYILYIGSAIEAILLSLALADKINVLQTERNASQKMSLTISQENERLIKQQNIVLEEKVTERTNELQITNHHLINTLTELKDAQMQLVEAEKMASLGQLTAGIAHEINNPINFVKSNIVPLKLDVKDIFSVIDKYDELHEKEGGSVSTELLSISSYKKEIDLDLVKKEIENLINGIEEGAERTAEIVRGLRTFSRVDESELKTANIHEGIDSTLVLLRNSMPAYIKVQRNYEANGEVECYPGKLNQVFMNILNNAIQAINSKQVINAEEYIIISTKDIEPNQIEITIKDSGAGMNDEVKQKIYEPFFTTKAVGEGTGLGMAIVFKIIEKHLGKINIISSVNNGAEFTIILPYLHPAS